MNNKFINRINLYPNLDKELINKALLIATDAHKNTYRESGEEYITHPINVANNLLDMEIYDTNTICAGLLHDVVEDTKITVNDVSKLINKDVSILVDGVTKIRNLDYNNLERSRYNTRKIINGLVKDVRIILIKLADRLHNMSTLEYKIYEKRIKNAKETLDLFVPLATSIGAYKIKKDLEDLSLFYLDNTAYLKIKEEKERLKDKFYTSLNDVKNKLLLSLNAKNINNEIIISTKNIYDTYIKINKGYNIENIEDLYYLKILTDTIDECFITLGLIHSIYPPLHSKFKDYIYNPKTNFYQSLHTTVFYKDMQTIKTKVRTFDMNKTAAYGVSSLLNQGKSLKDIQKMLLDKSSFVKKLIQIDKKSRSDKEFIERINNELLTDHIYPYKFVFS